MDLAKNDIHKVLTLLRLSGKAQKKEWKKVQTYLKEISSGKYNNVPKFKELITDILTQIKNIELSAVNFEIKEINHVSELINVLTSQLILSWLGNQTNPIINTLQELLNESIQKFKELHPGNYAYQLDTIPRPKSNFLIRLIYSRNKYPNKEIRTENLINHLETNTLSKEEKIHKIINHLKQNKILSDSEKKKITKLFISLFEDIQKEIEYSFSIRLFEKDFLNNLRNNLNRILKLSPDEIKKDLNEPYGKLELVGLNKLNIKNYIWDADITKFKEKLLNLETTYKEIKRHVKENKFFTDDNKLKPEILKEIRNKGKKMDVYAYLLIKSIDSNLDPLERFSGNNNLNILCQHPKWGKVIVKIPSSKDEIKLLKNNQNLDFIPRLYQVFSNVKAVNSERKFFRIKGIIREHLDGTSFWDIIHNKDGWKYIPEKILYKGKVLELDVGIIPRSTIRNYIEKSDFKKIIQKKVKIRLETEEFLKDLTTIRHSKDSNYVVNKNGYVFINEDLLRDKGTTNNAGILLNPEEEINDLLKLCDKIHKQNYTKNTLYELINHQHNWSEHPGLIFKNNKLISRKHEIQKELTRLVRILHRKHRTAAYDISPFNTLLTDQGKVKLFDFDLQYGGSIKDSRISNSKISLARTNIEAREDDYFDIQYTIFSKIRPASVGRLKTLQHLKPPDKHFY